MVSSRGGGGGHAEPESMSSSPTLRFYPRYISVIQPFPMLLHIFLDLHQHLDSRPTFNVKIDHVRESRKARQNRQIPQWIRLRTDNKISEGIGAAPSSAFKCDGFVLPSELLRFYDIKTSATPSASRLLRAQQSGRGLSRLSTSSLRCISIYFDASCVRLVDCQQKSSKGLHSLLTGCTCLGFRLDRRSFVQLPSRKRFRLIRLLLALLMQSIIEDVHHRMSATPSPASPCTC
eukprot:747261-Hanusia_phi.AAC.3